MQAPQTAADLIATFSGKAHRDLLALPAEVVYNQPKMYDVLMPSFHAFVPPTGTLSLSLIVY